MDFYETARRLVCQIVAAALSITVAVVERTLPFRPDWLERIAVVEAELRRAAGRRDGEGDADAPAAAGPGSGPGAPAGRPPAVDYQTLLAAYERLWRFAHDVRTSGLYLDEAFCARIEREWSVGTLLAYMRSTEKALIERAESAQADGNAMLAKLVAGSSAAR